MIVVMLEVSLLLLFLVEKDGSVIGSGLILFWVMLILIRVDVGIGDVIIMVLSIVVLVSCFRLV